ncbi:MAG: ATP-dependent Clp protease proteolytic subunit [Myxococcaceae bacterium]|nr:ATP-dependent Clp protease proteolytic subunit [Myxococcaceae bacterium]
MRPPSALPVALVCVTLALGAVWAQTPAPRHFARALPDIPKVGAVYEVELHGEIEPGLASFVTRVLAEHAREEEIVLLDINTLGGRLDSALAIRDALLAAKARTLCWVHPRAISAGALITLACDVVAIAPGGRLGAATPVQIGPSGKLSPVDAKITSWMRQEMAATAKEQRRDPLIAEAMVDASVEVPGLDGPDTLLTLDTAQALSWSIADLAAASKAELWQKLDRDPPRIELLRPTGVEVFAQLLSEPFLATALMILGLLGIAFELFHPSHGASLLFGLLCLGLFFFGHHVVALSGWFELGLVLAGVILIALEFVFPGHAVFGGVGLALVLGGLFFGLVSLRQMPLSVAWDTGIIPDALASVFGAVLCTLIAAALLIRYAPRSRYGKALILDAVSANPTRIETGIGVEALVGQTGVALTDLRPIGRIEVINKRIEAKVERGFVNAGGKVTVVRIDGGQVIVREAAEPVAGP